MPAPVTSSTSASKARPGKALGVRVEKSAARREAILSAALDEFSARGFATARMDDVARRAGVAKGTVYLYFRDKEVLFQELIRSRLVPLVGTLEAPPPADVPIRILLEGFIDRFVREIYGTRRRDVLRLVMTEGPRFPKLAEFHYRNVVERAMAAMRALLARAIERGELKHDALLQFPQLVVAPAMVAIIWSGLFERFAPLDVSALMRAHLDVLFGKEGGR
jgi:AcrR family transcriptional regulator